MNLSEVIWLAARCSGVTGTMPVKAAWDSSWRITERWTRAEWVLLERRSNLDIYRKAGLCLFFLPCGICFITAYFVSESVMCLLEDQCESRGASKALPGPSVAIWVAVWATSAPSPTPPPLPICPPSSPPSSSTICSLFLACCSAAGGRRDVLWRIPWTLISFKLAQSFPLIATARRRHRAPSPPSSWQSKVA